MQARDENKQARDKLRMELVATGDEKLKAMEESVLDKAAMAKEEVMTAVQIKTEEVMTGEVLKIKAEYATVSAQLLEIDLHVGEMKAIEKSTKKVEGGRSNGCRKQLNESLRMERSVKRK
jgi:hypothetical protein